MLPAVQEPVCAEGSDIFLQSDIIVFGYLAAHYAGAGGAFADGPRKGQPYQARPGWGHDKKIDAITTYDPEALNGKGAYVTWYASETIREWRGVKTKGLHIRKHYNRDNGGKTYEEFWVPIESFTKAMLVVEGIAL